MASVSKNKKSKKSVAKNPAKSPAKNTVKKGATKKPAQKMKPAAASSKKAESGKNSKAKAPVQKKKSSQKTKSKVVTQASQKKKKAEQEKSPKKISKAAKVKAQPLTQAEKEAIAKSKKEKLKEIAERENQSESRVSLQMLATPSDEMLRPFREAAKKNQELSKDKKAKKKAAFIAKPPKGAKKYAIDLRVHTPVSEGYFSTGGIDPAAAMVRLAKSKGLDMIAITDYNTADFVDLVKNEARETSVTILPGVDLQCAVGGCHEVSFVALFPEEYSSKEINGILEELGIPENAKGRKAFTLREELKRIIEVVESRGGILLPTRLDNTPHRVNAVKELVEKYGFHAFDLVHPDNPEYFKEHWPSGEFTFISSSNANALGQIGSRGMQLKLTSPGFSGLKSLFSRRNPGKSATK